MNNVRIQVRQEIDGEIKSKTLTVRDLGDYERIHKQLEFLFEAMRDHKALGEVTLTHQIVRGD